MIPMKDTELFHEIFMKRTLEITEKGIIEIR